MNQYMEKALELAEKAYRIGEVPVGAVLVHSASGNIVAEAHNLVETDSNPMQHAEMIVMQQGLQSNLTTHRLADMDLYVTLEPCPMCAGAISHNRINRLYFGAFDVKGGGVEHGPRIFQSSSCHHAPEVYGGIMEKKAATLLSEFFLSKRETR